MTLSSIGFGRNPFGRHEFGVGDWAEEMLWKNIPEFYRECDNSGPEGSSVSQPLRGFVDAIKPFYQDLRNKWGSFPTLWDAGLVPLDSLPALGYNVGITPDSTKPEGLQRSSVLNASQLWINKGNDRGYQITAAFEGLLVDITPLWSKTCAAASQLLGTIGAAPAPFDLSTTALVPTPIPPGSVQINVTTAAGLQQTIIDQGATTIELAIGAVVGGPFLLGEPLQGLSSGALANVSTIASTYLVVNHLTIAAGYTTGETLVGLTSGATTTLRGSVNHGRELLGVGYQPNGPLKKLATAAAVTLTLTSVTGILSTGDTLTQGLNTGTVLNVAGFKIKLLVTIGNFSAGAFSRSIPVFPVVTGVIGTVANDAFTPGEVIVGQTSGSTAVVRDNQTTYALVDTFTTNAGFSISETLIGSSSGSYAVAGATAELVPGPLRTTITFFGGAGSYVTNELVTGSISGAVGIVRVAGAGAIVVDTVTLPGFTMGETLTGATSLVAKTISTRSQGSINYITGDLVGSTIPLQAGSTATSVAVLVTSGPTQFLAQLDDVPADLIPLDSIKSNRYALWPKTLIPVRIRAGVVTAAVCRSYSLRLYFRSVDNTEIEDFISVASRITLTLETFRPVHVRFDKVSFDGSRASSQVWRTGTVSAESFATSTWTVSMSATQLASSQVWIVPTMTADVVS